MREFGVEMEGRRDDYGCYTEYPLNFITKCDPLYTIIVNLQSNAEKIITQLSYFLVSNPWVTSDLSCECMCSPQDPTWPLPARGGRVVCLWQKQPTTADDRKRRAEGVCTCVSDQLCRSVWTPIRSALCCVTRRQIRKCPALTFYQPCYSMTAVIYGSL